MKWPFGSKNGVSASANLDDVRRAFYGNYVPGNKDANWWWIQAVLIDPNELIVEDDESGQLYKLALGSDSDGTITFGEPEPVRIPYLPDNREAALAAAPHVAATLAIGRQVLASWTTREDSVLPDNTQGGAMDPKEVRQRLGLTEDASDDQVKQALRELNSAVGIPVAEAEPATPATPVTPVTPVATPATPVEPAAPATPATPTQPEPIVMQEIAASLPPGMVVVDARQWEAVTAASGKAISFVEKQEERDREAEVVAAMRDGRIAPESKDDWIAFLKQDPNGSATLAAMRPGLVPVELRGYAPGSAELSADPVAASLTPEVVQEWTAGIFPEVRNRRMYETALAAGETHRNRITADATYRR